MTLLLAALAAASATYWVLQWPHPASASADTLSASTEVSPSPAAVARALGSSGAAAPAAAEAPVSSRFVLTGVVAGGVHKGAALIAVDGRAPKPFRIGATVADSWVLQAVQARRATLHSPAGPDIDLDLPARK